MKKIFGILVVLMVAGTFVSCNMPTNAGTSDNESDAVKATVNLAQDSKGSPICVIEFNGKYFWCTVKAFDIIGGKECTIKTDYYGQPDYEGIEYMECQSATDGYDVDSSIICVKGEVNYFRACIEFNNSTKDRGDYYYYKDSSIYYKQ